MLDMFKNKGAGDWIAIILALTVAYVFVTRMLLIFLHPEIGSVQTGAIWLDILKYIVGGLIGYMSRGNERQS